MASAVEEQVKLRQLGSTTVEARDLPNPGEERVKWSHNWIFTLSTLGYVVGFGNVLSFPYLAYKHGGGSFLIAYTVMLFLIGLPLFFLEVTIGQFLHKGPSRVFREMAPAMKGIGFAMLFITCLTAIYYNILIAWAIHYLFSGMTTNIPWLSMESLDHVDRYHDHDHEQDLDESCILPTLKYFNRTIGLGDGSINNSPFEGMNWENVGCSAASWVVVCVCCILGIRSIGKAVRFTVPFPYLVLVIMFIWSLTLKGADKGIRHYLTPKTTSLFMPETWSYAALQNVYTLSVGMGGLTSLASHNNFYTNCHRSSLIICITNYLTSIFAGFSTFAILGHLADSAGLKIKDMLEEYGQEGPHMAFLAYLMAIKFSPSPHLWSFLFLLMLITLGLDSNFVNIDMITTAFEETFGCVRRNNRDDIQC